MKPIVFLTAALLTAQIAQSQSVGETLRAPEKAVPVVNQNLAGTWLYELRRGGQPATQPPVLLLIQFNGDGGITAAAADGSQTSHHGVWLRVGDRKFLITTFLFGFNESRALSGITKIRANVQLSADGQTAKGTQEVVVLDREGKAMATIPGGIFTGTRLTPEIPGDFHEFQNMPCDVPSGARTPPAPSTRCVSADARNADRAATQQACEPKFTAVRRQDSSVDEIAAGSRAR